MEENVRFLEDYIDFVKKLIVLKTNIRYCKNAKR